MTLDPIQLTRQLIDIESITYNEGAVGIYIANLLEERGWAVERTLVEQDDESRARSQARNQPRTERYNIYAGRADEIPDLVFSTHIDTVPPFIPSSEDDDFIYGRGACDAKGIVAAQIAAAERLRDEGFKVGLLFVVGEERDSAGAKLANEMAKPARFLVNGEPTDNRLAVASKGVLRVLVQSHGKMAHSAYPELGDSAINKLVEALHRLLALELPVVEGIGPSTLNIGLIEGGRATNVIADQAEAQILIRLVGSSESTRDAIREAVKGLAEVDFTLEIPFVRMRELKGLPTMVAAFASDVPALTNWGEPLMLGPGSIHVAHTPHEKLAKKELFEAIELYAQIARRLLS